MAGMTIPDFWDADLSEVYIALNAHQRRLKEQYELQAWAVARIIQPHIKKAITPNQLLGKKRELTAQDFNSAKEMRAYYKNVKRQKELKKRAQDNRPKTPLEKFLRKEQQNDNFSG